MKDLFQTIPQINTNDKKVEIIEWLVADKSYVEAGQDLVDLGTSKAVVTIQATHSGYITRRAIKGDLLLVGETFASFYASIETLEADTQTAPSVAAKPALDSAPRLAQKMKAPHRPERLTKNNKSFSFTHLSPAAEKLAKDLGLGSKELEGLGLVTVRILKERFQMEESPIESPLESTMEPASARVERVPLAKMAEIDTLTVGQAGNIESSLTIYFDSIEIRKRLEKDQLFEGLLLPVLLFEISRLIQKQPRFTSFYENGKIHYYDKVDIGVAIDLDKGLKVVTLSDTDKLLPNQIFEKIIDAGLRYSENQLLPEELEGSTITVTDLSALDVLNFQPLINGKQSAIIGIGGDSLMRGHPMSITITFDHRVLTGKEVGLFLKELRGRVLSYIEPKKIPFKPQALWNAEPSEVRCDFCLIDLNTYHDRYPKQAIMQLFVHPLGQIAYICHVCLTGH